MEPRTFSDGRRSIIRYDQHDWAACYDGQILGCTTSEADAWLLAANHERDLLTHGMLSPATEPDSRPDLWEPYSGAPVASDHPIPTETLDRAHTYYSTYYGDRPDLCRAADRARDALTTRPWRVLPNGDLELTGSRGDTYRSGAECVLAGRTTTNRQTGKHGPVYCPSYQRGQGPHCYHQVARELVRLAQLFLGIIADPSIR